METFFYILSLSALFIITQGKSIAESNNTAETNSSPPWIPKNMTLEDWRRCNGLPCDQFDRVQSKLAQLQMLTFEDQGLPTNIAYDISREDFKYDGCILLNEAQLDHLITEYETDNNSTASTDNQRKKRSLTNFDKMPGLKWKPQDFPVGYTFDGKHSPEQRAIIKGAINHWEAQTCLRFREMQPNEATSVGSYIVFVGEGYTCHSYVGKQGLPQPVFLAETCLWDIGITVHEIGHVFGMWHTHMRFDRDQFVKIHYENLGYYTGQFNIIKDTVSLGLPYDFESILHYAAKDGSFNGQDVIEPLPPYKMYGNSMGQRVELSFYDAMTINLEYCKDTCRGPTRQPCQRGGYQDPNNCNKCKCPSGFGGDYCERVAISSQGCEAGVISLSYNEQRMISSPAYDGRTHYFDFTECNWMFRAPEGQFLSLSFPQFEKFGIVSDTKGECQHWLEVKNGSSWQMSGIKFCGSDPPTVNISSEGNEMIVIFKSNYSSSNQRANIGFKALISSVSCSNRALACQNGGDTRITGTPVPPPCQNGGYKDNSYNDKCICLPSFYGAYCEKRIPQASGLCERKTRQPCKRGGVQDVNNCDVCVCPEGFSGEFCENVAPSVPANCGGNIIMTMFQFKTINSPNYSPGRENYPSYSECNWLIRAPANWSLSLQFIKDFGIPSDSQEGCTNYVEIKSTSVWKDQGKRFCGSKKPDDIIVSDTEEMLVSFKSKYYSSDSMDKIGFQAVLFLVPDYIKDSGKPDSKSTTVPSTQTSTKSSTTIKTTTTPVPIVQDQNPGNFLWFCNFETVNSDSTMCGIDQSETDDFDWNLNSGKTGSVDTGPNGAFNGLYYLYMEASEPRKLGDQAVIKLPKFRRRGQHCLSWRYYMYGYHVNTLQIVIESDGRYDVVWKRTGQQLPAQWWPGTVSINLTEYSRILFIGIRGQEYSGDIAIDALSLMSGNC